MVKILDAMRPRALVCVCHGFRPSVPAEWVATRLLGYDKTEAGLSFMEEAGALLQGGEEDMDEMDTKESVVAVTAALQEMGFTLI